MQLHQLTIKEADDGLKAKKFSARELTESCLAQIKKTDDKVRSFITVTAELALKQADEIDKKIKQKKKLSPLVGIPASIKDVILTEDILTTASSNILKNYIGVYDATAVAKLKKEGIVILGKTNCDAFAHGASTENSDFGPSHNPWDLARVPGGSSGGSASSVASDQAIYSLGTDTGGSIRQPAAFCGMVGLKPTYGRVSRYGLIAMTSSTDCLSPLTKTVEDAAIVLQAIAGQDKFDSSTPDVSVPDYSKELKKGIKGLKIGVPREYFIEGMNKEVTKRVREAIKQLSELGATVKEISLPHTKYAVAAYYIITPSELSTNLARFDGIKYGYSIVNDPAADKAGNLFEVFTKSRRNGFGSEAKRRIMIGTHSLSSGYYDAYYLQASKVRTLLRQDFEKAFAKVDIIAAPTSPNVAFKIGAQVDDPLKMYLEDVFLTAASLAGQPAISIPCGFAAPEDEPDKKLPVGLQLIGKHFDEVGLLRAAYAYEQSTDWHQQKPH